jgi:2-keto-4-pentenoate hydratase/2-oxohepta-3-ene-1,7-dioic acid hydratase in catechol pathway
MHPTLNYMLAGQIMLPREQAPIFSPSLKLDYELELGIYIGQGNASGEPIELDQADAHVFSAYACSTTGPLAISRRGRCSR